MKVAVLGAGLMGKEAARDLIQSNQVKAVGLADLDVSRAKKVCAQFKSDKLTPFRLDASNRIKLAEFIGKYDVVINALFYSFNEIVAETAIEVGVSAVDLGGHIGHITDKVLELTEKARAARTSIIPDLGVAPG